jgi:hypothetical protein
MTKVCGESPIRSRPSEKKLPDFARVCASDVETVILHQDAFAADYQDDAYNLLGMAIKYAGLHSKEVHVTGKNRSTLGEEDRIQGARSHKGCLKIAKFIDKSSATPPSTVPMYRSVQREVTPCIKPRKKGKLPKLCPTIPGQMLFVRCAT